MNRKTTLTIVGIVLAAGCAVFASTRGATARAPVGSDPEGALDVLRADFGRFTDQQEEQRATLVALSARVAQLEERSGRTAALPGSGSDAPAPAAEDAAATRSAAQAPMSADEFRGLLAAVLREEVVGSASAEDQARFWKAARESNLVTTVIGELEGRVANTPDDLAARMQLADAYVAKITTMPGGPEQGVWGTKAEQQWQAVIDRDPDHWEAQFALAYNFTWYPTAMGKAADAVRGFEECLRIQEHSPAEARHVATYRNLGRLYEQQQQRDRAVRVLQQGLARHPGEPGLTADLQRMTSGNREDNK
jgi:tetratricopeptide (TPR) repeat protein